MLIAIITALTVGVAAAIGAQAVETEVENLRQESNTTPTTDTTIKIEQHDVDTAQKVEVKVRHDVTEATESADQLIDQRLQEAKERTEGKFFDAIERVKEHRQNLPDEFHSDLEGMEQELHQAEQDMLHEIEQMR